ncbi:MAG: hypothetical protein OEQ53_06940 [Saprospiraceae bacterium]|nr:hypothetical protein [Saprospiraceae bacterium]
MKKIHQFRYVGIVFYLVSALMGWQCSSNSSKAKIQKKGPGFLAAIKNDSILDISLTFNLAELHTHLEDEAKIDATMEIQGLRHPVRLASRGVTRKKICSFPPLHLHLPDSIDNPHAWGPYKKYKLVTHCQDEYHTDEFVLKEFLTYRLYRKLTPFGLEAQLCRVHYQTEEGQTTRFGFIIEDDEEMASRANGRLIKGGKATIPQVHKEQYQQLVLFQYMVGNTDWNLSRRHNIKFIQLSNSSSPVPVPYDFDYSGLVDAPYAVPHPSLPINKVSDRLWQYRGKPTDDLSAAVTHFLTHKDELLQLIHDFSWISSDGKTRISEYLLSFYDQIEEPDGIRTLLTSRVKSD